MAARAFVAAGDAGNGVVDVDATGDANAEPVAVPQVGRQTEDKIGLLPLAHMVAGADPADTADGSADADSKRVAAS